MLNKMLMCGPFRVPPASIGAVMFQLGLAFFIIGVGMSVAGMGTHLYQGLSRQPAGFRFSGQTPVESVFNLFVTFICGPYIMLAMGWKPDTQGKVSLVNGLLGSFIAFGWSFMTGMMILTTYIGVVRAIA